MKSFIQVALAFVGTIAVPAWLSAQAVGPTPVATNDGPKIQFNTEDYDFGQIIPGNPLEYTFTMTNAGDEPLVVSNVKPSCGCTTIGATFPQTLAAHSSAKIPLKITTSGKGTFLKTVAVTSNDKDKARQNVTLRLHFTAWVPIDVTPQARGYFTFMPDSEFNPPTTLHIVNNTPEPLTLSTPVCTTASFSAELKTRVPGREFDLVITPAPLSKLRTNPNITIVQGDITMKTSVSNMPVLTIPVVASIQRPIVVTPDRIMLPPGPLNRAITNWITVRANTSKGMMVSDAKANVDRVSVRIEMLQTNKVFVIPVAFPVGFELKKGDNVSVTLKTDMPGYSTVTLPVDLMPGVPAVPAANPVRQTPGGRMINSPSAVPMPPPASVVAHP